MKQSGDGLQMLYADVMSVGAENVSEGDGQRFGAPQIDRIQLGRLFASRGFAEDLLEIFIFYFIFLIVYF